MIHLKPFECQTLHLKHWRCRFQEDISSFFLCFSHTLSQMSDKCFCSIFNSLSCLSNSAHMFFRRACSISNGETVAEALKLGQYGARGQGCSLFPSFFPSIQGSAFDSFFSANFSSRTGFLGPREYVRYLACQISKVTQGANCPIRSFPPITCPLSDWHFPFTDPGL